MHIALLGLRFENVRFWRHPECFDCFQPNHLFPGNMYLECERFHLRAPRLISSFSFRQRRHWHVEKRWKNGPMLRAWNIKRKTVCADSNEFKPFARQNENWARGNDAIAKGSRYAIEVKLIPVFLLFVSLEILSACRCRFSAVVLVPLVHTCDYVKIDRPIIWFWQRISCFQSLNTYILHGSLSGRMRINPEPEFRRI